VSEIKVRFVSHIFLHTSVSIYPLEMQIHIIEDDWDILTMLTLYFKKSGYDVVADYNGNDLIIGCEPCPDIYLIDINLIGKNGGDICKAIKDDCYQTLVALMSANMDIAETAHECHADTFFCKPFEMKNVVATVTALVQDQYHN